MEQASHTTHTTHADPDDAGGAPLSRRLDPLALFAGIVFVAVAVVGLTDRIVLSVGDLRWIGPILLVAFGIVLVATAAGGRDRGQPAGSAPDTAAGAAGPVDAAAHDAGPAADATEPIEEDDGR